MFAETNSGNIPIFSQGNRKQCLTFKTSDGILHQRSFQTRKNWKTVTNEGEHLHQMITDVFNTKQLRLRRFQNNSRREVTKSTPVMDSSLNTVNSFVEQN
ncbi:hypothetical protein AB6A40_007280 [Gnathostoma spinigerum]|uniref:Uncharacterized protein n=1 Tax=Gnathostoma spinigerum TaxID=75299 RepID=A0ABD6ELC1_9BILA